MGLKRDYKVIISNKKISITDNRIGSSYLYSVKESFISSKWKITDLHSHESYLVRQFGKILFFFGRSEFKIKGETSDLSINFDYKKSNLELYDKTNALDVTYVNKDQYLVSQGAYEIAEIFLTEKSSIRDGFFGIYRTTFRLVLFDENFSTTILMFYCLCITIDLSYGYDNC